MSTYFIGLYAGDVYIGQVSVEPRESGSSAVRRETPRIDIGGVRREAHAVGRWAGRRERALSRRHDCLDTAEV